MGSDKWFALSGSDEWYTPEPYLKSVRAVLGEISVDPCSCTEANRAVGAKSFLTDYKLLREAETVFCNPPFSLCKEILTHLSQCKIQHRIVLTNAATSARWFQFMWAADVLCFTDHRIRFQRPDGWQWVMSENACALPKKKASSSNTMGQCFALFSKSLAVQQRFIDEFTKHGEIIRPRC